MFDSLKQIPNILASQFGPKEIPRGFIWAVNFQLPEPAKNDGYIIQFISQKQSGTNSSGVQKSLDISYWEAWKVLKGSITSTTKKSVATFMRELGGSPPNNSTYNASYNDFFFHQFKTGNKGKYKIYGSVGFYEETLPSDFIINNLQTGAGPLLSTTKCPPFWSPFGRDRELTYECDFTAGNNSTTFRHKFNHGEQLIGFVNPLAQMYKNVSGTIANIPEMI